MDSIRLRPYFASAVEDNIPMHVHARRPNRSKSPRRVQSHAPGIVRHTSTQLANLSYDPRVLRLKCPARDSRCVFLRGSCKEIMILDQNSKKKCKFAKGDIVVDAYCPPISHRM